MYRAVRAGVRAGWSPGPVPAPAEVLGHAGAAAGVGAAGPRPRQLPGARRQHVRPEMDGGEGSITVAFSVIEKHFFSDILK